MIDLSGELGTDKGGIILLKLLLFEENEGNGDNSSGLICTPVLEDKDSKDSKEKLSSKGGGGGGGRTVWEEEGIDKWEDIGGACCPWSEEESVVLNNITNSVKYKSILSYFFDSLIFNFSDFYDFKDINI